MNTVGQYSYIQQPCHFPMGIYQIITISLSLKQYWDIPRNGVTIPISTNE